MEIERLAREAGLGPLLDNSLRDGDDVWIDCDVFGGLEKLVKNIAAQEREACADLCELHAKEPQIIRVTKITDDPFSGYALDCAGLIRMRGRE